MSRSPAPQASEAARRRLGELFDQLNTSSTPTPAEPTVSLDEADRAAGDWVDRLRVAPSVDVADKVPNPIGEIATRLREFTSAHLASVIVVLVVALAWSVYSLLQVRTTPVAEAAGRVEVSAAPTATTAPPETVVVHVIGAVARPGVVHLADGARVGDAIEAAGGLTSRADIGELNLAQPAVDGTQVKIGTTAHPGGWVRSPGGESAASGSAGTSGSGASSRIALNSATAEQLDALPGIGPVTAHKIIAWRTAHKKFTSVTELQEVDGIGPKTYADIVDRVRL